MVESPRTVRWVQQLSDPTVDAAVTLLRGKLAAAGFAAYTPGAGSDSPAATVVWTDVPMSRADREALIADPALLILAGSTLHGDAHGEWTERTGLLTAGASPIHDVRLRPGAAAGSLADRLTDHDHDGGAHLGEHTHITDRVLGVEKIAEDVEVLITAQLGLITHPVAAVHGRTLAWTLGTTAEAISSPAAVRLFVLAVRRLLGIATPPPVRVGLLGFGGIGAEHARAVAEVSGLTLATVCDRDPRRLAAASAIVAGVHTSTDAAAMVDGDDTDLIVVSTPPDTHASWALRALDAGKHVIVEKPFAIRTSDADQVLAAAAAASRLAVVYQNRRFDPDHLAISRAVRSGRIGEVFHIETFVGGYGHPCNLWHSDASISGGVFFDWGAHILDQVLDLVPAPVVSVSAVEHKRRWFDVTNADHARVTTTFDNGVDAQFVYSDLAAALKPRWYVLGTTGAIVGNWRVERVVGRNDVGTLAEDVLAPADSPPVLDLYEPDGSVTRLATPAPAPHSFHRELADALLLGLPMSVTGATSRRVLSVLAAASESAADGGRAVVPQ